MRYKIKIREINKPITIEMDANVFKRTLECRFITVTDTLGQRLVLNRDHIIMVTSEKESNE